MDQMNAISEEQEAPAASEVLSPMESSTQENRMAAPLPPPPPSADPEVVEQANEPMSAVEAPPSGKILGNIDLSIAYLTHPFSPLFHAHLISRTKISHLALFASRKGSEESDVRWRTDYSSPTVAIHG
jgi:hypothetical protein